MRVTDYNFALLPNRVLSQSERSCLPLSHEERVQRQGATIGYPAWGLLYFSALTSLPSDGRAVVVETGTSLGLSTIVLAQAVADRGGGIVHTVEPRLKRVGEAREHVRQAGLTHLVEFYRGDGATFLKSLALPAIHFAFLDGCHDRDSVVAEFEAVESAVRTTGGMIAFDNANSGPVNVALKEIVGTHGGNLVRFKNCSWCPPGMAIWQP